jgi:hypothetical protein
VLTALVVQGQWFQYHLAALPVLGAALWALALARHPHRPLLAATALLGVATPLVAGRSLPWRSAHAGLAFGVLSAVVLAVFAAACAVPPRPPRYGQYGRYGAIAAAVLALAIPAWPTTPYSYDTRHSSFTALERARAREDLSRWLDGVRERIGAGTPVTYLAFGDIGYLLGNPTHCRYPTPDFLQRTRYDPEITGQVSYRENLRCLDDPAARYAVLDTFWFPPAQVAPEVSAAVRARYDCSAPVDTYPALHLVICPRR